MAQATKSTAAKSTAPAKAPATAAAGSLLNPASLKATAPATFKTEFVTTKGNIVIEVHRDWAPLGADRFFNLVKNGFFTDVAFFRAIQGFMVQFGISGNPKIAAAWEHANIKDDPVKGTNTRGMITYAMAGPNTRSTQFFINFGNNASLDSQGFAPFGMVVEGLDVVDKLYTGYGEMAEAGGRGPSVDKLSHEGKAYLDKSFPMIDSIKSARILPADAAPAK
jgi:peptidyl-prolyl cis-trans isomerase A (cyclophilin A)